MAHTSTPSIAIIVLNWNGIKDTIACLDSLADQSIPATIVVIDNGSSDDSRVALEEYRLSYKGNIEVIYNSKNFGFAGGVNTGIEWALSENYDFIALFNNDAVADKHWLNNLLQSASDRQIGIVTSLLLHEDEKSIDSTGEQYSKWGLPFPRSRGDKRAKAPEASLVFGASGGASLYKTEMLRDIGLFDDDFFAYYEDVDISFRAQLAGWKVAYEPKAIAYHKRGRASKKIPGFTVYQTFKNLPLLFLKNVPRELLMSIGIRFYFAYIMMFLNAVAKGSGAPAIKGAGRSFVLGFKALSARKDIQKNKHVTAEYIKSILWNDLPPDQTGLRKLRSLFIGKS